MNKLLFIIFLLFTIETISIAQQDKEFWFVAPEITEDHHCNSCATPIGGEPIYFFITTGNVPATVSFDEPANPAFPDTTIYVPANTSFRLDLTYTISEVENYYGILDGIPGKNNKGIHITSTSLINIYYEVAQQNNPDLFTLMGKNGLGTEFYTSFQTDLFNMNVFNISNPSDPNNWNTQATSSFDIVATEDNTLVNIEIPAGKTIYPGMIGPFTYSIILNKGQTYSAVPDRITTPPNNWKPSDLFGRAAEDHLAGCRVTSNKPIAITLKDDSMKSLRDGCYDLAGDQTIPTSIIGKQYVVMKGQLSEGNTNTSYPPTRFVIQERVYILGTANGDSIYIDDTLRKVINRGETFMYELKQAVSYIKTTQKSYVWQISGWGCEMGGTILPSIDKCTGSLEVAFTRSGATTEEFFLNLMVRKGAESSFLINDNPTTLIKATDFQNIPGNNDWLSARLGPLSTTNIPLGVPIKVSNTKDVFHLGVINGGSNSGTRFGYFSNYNEFQIEAFNTKFSNAFFRGCFGDTAQLIANGGYSVRWEPPTYLDDPLSSTPISRPIESIVYYAIVEGVCKKKDTATVNIDVSYPIYAKFKIDNPNGCSPLNVSINHFNKGVNEIEFYLGDGVKKAWKRPLGDSISYDSTFLYQYNNTTDTTIQKELLLITYNINSCSDSMWRWVTVYPEMTGAFTTTDTIGCPPFLVNFTNTSTGDTNDFHWNFGDGGGNFTVNTSNTYYNYTNKDTTYHASLEAISKFYCRDTVRQDIVVHPYIDVNFTIDTVAACSPYIAILHNLSIQATSYKLDWGDGTPIVNLTGAAFPNGATLTHNYTNLGTVPLNYSITLIGYNTHCSDTLTRNITVFPEIHINITPSDTAGCDSTVILFSNISTEPLNTKYMWDFKDGNSTIQKNPSHLFTNKTNTAVVYPVQIVAETPNYCRDTLIQNIRIYPYVAARFTLDTAAACPPFNISIKNVSVAVDTFYWDFGDGNTSTDDSSIIRHVYLNNQFKRDTFYNLSLYVRNQYGCKDTLKRKVTVYTNVIAHFDVDGIIKCYPYLYKFNSHSKDSGGVNFLWDFGDGATSNSKDSITHLYERNLTSVAKTYRVSLEVRNTTQACANIKDTLLTVNPFVQARILNENNAGCSPFKTTIGSTIVGLNVERWWYINGVLQLTSKKDTITRTFTNYGSTNLTYYISQIVEQIDGKCRDTVLDSVIVYPQVIARYKFTKDSIGCSPLVSGFENYSLNANKYFWEFNDGTNSNRTDQFFDHIFTNFTSADIVYDVKLIAESDFCKDSIKKSLFVYTLPKANFDISTSGGCSPLTNVQFINKSSASTNYIWNFDNGNTQTTTSMATITQQYINKTATADQLKTIQLIAQNQTCADTVYRNLHVYNEVTAIFAPQRNDSCHKFYVRLDNNSKYADFYTWDYGDGSLIDKNAEPSHIFENFGTSDVNYTVKLTASSKYNCVHDTTSIITVHPSPRADFLVNPIQQDFPDTVVYFSKIEPVNNPTWTYNWDFGDGTTFTGYNPVKHQYQTWDTFDITLTVSANNCTDKITYPVVIYSPIPIAKFITDKDTGCVPLTIQFTNQSKYASSYKWQFKDPNSGTSTFEHPSYTFTEPGTYRVILTAYGDGGQNTYYYPYYIRAYQRPNVKFDVSPDTVMLPDDYIRCFNKSTPLEEDSIKRYLWDFGDSTYSELKDPSHLYGPPPEVFRSIKLTVWTNHDCSSSDSIIDAVWVEGTGLIKYPNVFIPSASGSNGGYIKDIKASDNSVFRPFSDGVIEYHLEIYNRWGERVFITNNINQGWDGYYKNTIAKQGVYIWKVNGKYSNGKPFVYAGDVTLLTK